MLYPGPAAPRMQSFLKIAAELQAMGGHGQTNIATKRQNWPTCWSKFSLNETWASKMYLNVVDCSSSES